MRDETRILIIHPGALGDLLLALPAIRSLRATHAACRITIIAGPSLLSFLDHHHIADSTISIDGRAVAALCSGTLERHTPWGDFYAAHDIVIAWVEDRDRTMEHTLSAMGVSHCLFQSPRLAAARGISVSEWHLTSIGRFFGTNDVQSTILAPTPHEREIGDTILRKRNLLPNRRKIFAFHPGSGSVKKNWDVQRFVDVLRYVQHMPELAPVVLCGPADDLVVSSFISRTQRLACPEPPVLNGLSLLELTGVLAHCAGYVGNDSGVTHLSAAVGVPTIAIFGPTDPTVWAPTGSHVRSIRGPVMCLCRTPAERNACHQPCFPETAELVTREIRTLFSCSAKDVSYDAGNVSSDPNPSPRVIPTPSCPLRPR